MFGRDRKARRVKNDALEKHHLQTILKPFFILCVKKTLRKWCGDRSRVLRVRSMASQLSNSIAKRVGPYDDRKRTIIVTNNEMRLDDYQKVTEIIIEHQRQRDILKPKENIKFFCKWWYVHWWKDSEDDSSIFGCRDEQAEHNSMAISMITRYGMMVIVHLTTIRYLLISCLKNVALR